MLASRKRAKPSSNLPQDCRLARQANDSFSLVQFLNGVDARRRYESIPLVSRKLLSWRGILFSLSAIQEVAEPRKQLGLTQYPPKPSRRPKLLPLEYPYGGPVGSEGWGPNSPSGALTWGLGGLLALDQFSPRNLIDSGWGRREPRTGRCGGPEPDRVLA